MPATPRDALKTRRQRIGEVYALNQLQAGQANSQLVSFGCQLVPGTTNTSLGITVGEFVIGQTVVPFAGIATGIAVPAGAQTSSIQFCKVLVEVDGNNAGAQTSANVFLTAGPLVTGSQSAAPLPALTPTRIAIGWLEIPSSFTPGSTALTAGMCKQVAYWGSN